MKQVTKTSITGLDVELAQGSLMDIIATKLSVSGKEEEDAFFMADLGDIVHKYRRWVSQLPRVQPHYAVKCNDDPAVLAVLAHLGTGFDCASKAEIKKIIDMKVPASRIIYANPCKQASHIKFAAQHSVDLMTFDNETELHKIKSLYPNARLVLRILPPDDTKSQCQLGMKYGCPPKQAGYLLKVAKELDLDVIGVSFHVGSGCYDASAFSSAVVSARAVFDVAAQEGFNFTLLDIGGGFPGQDSAKISFEEICDELRPALDEHFPEGCGVRIISEPGRFFVASAFTLAVNIIAKRVTARDMDQADGHFPNGNDEPSFMYYINDGVYGSFNCLLYDHAEVKPYLINDHDEEPRFTSSIWGPTCDGLDCVLEEYLLPELNTGDWLMFPDMGAYTMCAGSTFNGMPKPACFYVAQEEHWEALQSVSAAPYKSSKKSCSEMMISCSPSKIASRGLPLEIMECPQLFTQA